MAIEQVSRPFVISRLKDNSQICPNSNDKADYFRSATIKAYPVYKKAMGEKGRSYESFVDIVLRRHSHTILNQSVDFQKNYFKNDTYISKLIKDTIKAEEAKADLDHTFTRGDYIDPVILQFENLVDRRYKNLLAVDQKAFDYENLTLFTLTKRFFEQLISGLVLLEREAYNDAFIVWRSLLETTTTLVILSNHPKLTGKYTERQKSALRRMKIIAADKNVQLDKLREAQSHLGQKNVPWYTAERFGWAGSLLTSKEFNLKALLDVIKLGMLHRHYTFASLFVHEYLITPTILKMDIDFQNYLLTLYFRLYEQVRVIVSDKFTNDLSDAKKLEGGIRAEIKNFATRFNDFSRRIENA